MIISAQPASDGRTVRGTSLVVQDWPADGQATEVAPLHVHYGALRFRFADHEVIAAAGSTVLVPAGVPHTFGNAGPGPSRFIIILPARLDELISVLHEAAPAEHLAIYRRFQSELLE
jgi:hypothetical protein